MPLGNDGFFNMNEFANTSDTSFFTNIDTKTILGKNLVLNFLGKIEFEIKALGFSDTANEIAEYYEEAKKQGGIVEFFSNPVIKMILQEIQNKTVLKNYLKQRIFDDIEQEKIKCFNNTYNNNEKITEDIEKEKQEFLKQKRLKDKKIKKIMEEKNVSYEQAKKIYEKDLQNSLNTKIDEIFKGFLSEGALEIDTCQPFNFKIEDVNYEENKKNRFKKTKKIKLDNDTQDDQNTDNDNFWS